MKCPRCQSENVQVQSKEYKPKLTVPILMVGAGFGLVFGGLIGAVIGLVIGGVVAAIVHAVTPQTYRPVVVCQQCGFIGNGTTVASVNPTPAPTPAHSPVPSSEPEERNFSVVRTSSSVGTVCKLGIRIDDSIAFELGNGEVKSFHLTPGTHKVTYYQINGMGKDKRNGSVNVNIGENKRSLRFYFLHNGLDVKILGDE